MGRSKHALLVFVYLVSPLIVIRSIQARPGGISGYSGSYDGGGACNGCHYGGVQPTVTLSGPLRVEPGTTHAYTLTIDGGQELGGGLDVAASAGALAVIDPGTHLLFGEITHTAPRPVDANLDVVFSFNWTAPVTPYVVTLQGAGNSVNLNSSNRGDRSGADALTILVGGGSSPGEPSGPASTPLVVDYYDEFSGDLYFTYQPGCSTADNNVYFGLLSDVGALEWSSESCHIGNYGWGYVNPGLEESYFFVVVGTRGGEEGSYGRSSVGGVESERPPHAGSTCGEVQVLGSLCE